MYLSLNIYNKEILIIEVLAKKVRIVMCLHRHTFQFIEGIEIHVFSSNYRGD